jgi:LuxR family transcriptional regulator, maltose regulon positive regulatory protein
VRERRDTALPPLFRRHTRRPRLTALLDEATAQAILVTAPAGYGKTTLAREWLQGRTDVAWYHATPSSADVGAFSAGLADVVEPIVPGAGQRVRQRLRVGDATERLSRPLAELLAEDLESWPEGGIVVLDDYHLMAESAPVEDFLDWLLMLAPIRVLVTTRRRPSWATARRFLYDEAVELGRDQLAMTDEEAARVLSGRSTESVHALVRQAEGWPALIGLAALSADLEFPPEKVSESLFRYFAEEVLRAEPEEVQRFMLAASVPSTISARLARGALRAEAPEPLMGRLRGEDLLYEVDVDELRFHPLLRDFLRRRLQADAPAEYAELAGRVIEDAVAHARWGEAFELAVETEDKTHAAEIAGQAARTLLAAGQSETLEKWLAACGAAGVTVPGASLARAEILIRKGEMSAAAAVAGDTASRLKEDHPDYAWACNVAGRALHFTSEEEAAFERFEAARRTASTDEDMKEALWGLLLAATEIAPETMAGYLDALETGYSDDIDVRFRLAIGRYGTAEQTSSISGEWQRFLSLLPLTEHATDPLAVSSFLATASSAARLRGQYVQALELADRAHAVCIDLRLEFGAGACLVGRIAAEIGLRLFSRAKRSLNAFARTSTRREDPYYRLEGLTLQARLRACEGDLIGALLTQHEVAGLRAPPRALGVFLSTLAMIEAAAGEVDRSRELTRHARGNGTNIEMQLGCRLAEAIAASKENPEEAKDTVLDAVVACGSGDCLDGLVFAYRIHPPLLDTAAENPAALAIVRRALSSSRDVALGKRIGMLVMNELSEDPLSDLTPREREVLGLLSEGLTNAEIASRLYITPSTAKVHVRHILEKLGARNRLQAVLRAQGALELEEI